MNPSLVEDGVKNFMNTTLNNCYQKKMEVYSWVVNITCFVVFFILLVSILYLFKKPKLTPYEMNEKMQREQEYVVSKIRDYKEMHRSSSRITDLPIA
jgi:F0F1-type ATP synthase membrane subunit a